MASNSAPNSGKLDFSSDEASYRSPGSTSRPRSTRAKLGTLAKAFSQSTNKSPSLPELATSEKDAELAADVAVLAGPKPVAVSAHSQHEALIGHALEEWKRSTKLSVTVTGQSSVGKSYLINTLLEASAPAEYDHARRDETLPSIAITSEEGALAIGDGNAQFGAASPFSALASPDVSPPSSEKLHLASRTPSPPGSDRFEVEALRSDLRHMGVDSAIKEYGKETGYSFEGNAIVPAAARSRRNSAAEAPRTYKGFSVEEFLDATNKSAEHVYTPAAHTPYASVPATPGGSEISELELDTRDGRRSTYKRATVYLFNGVSTSSTDEKTHVNLIPMHASKTFFPDELWSSTIDWHKERQQQNDYQSLLDNALQQQDSTTLQIEQSQNQSSADNQASSANAENQQPQLPPIKIDDRKSYLLPQGQSNDVPQLVAVRYGRVPELIVSFPQEGELRLALWELHEIVTLGTKQFQSEAHKRITETRYRRLLGLADEIIAIPLSNVDSPQELPLDRDVTLLLGQNFRFVGLGKSLAQDRVFVREKLQEITNQYAFHMCKFLVRVPSSILDGNKELIEMSGPYIHGDFGTKSAVENTNLLLVAVDRMRGLSSDIVHLLQDSSLAHKLATKPDLHKAIFVELAERYNLALPNSASISNPSVDTFKQTLLDQWRTALLLASTPAQNQISAPSLAAPSASSVSPSPSANSSTHMDETIPFSNVQDAQMFNGANSLSMRSAISEATLEQLVASTTVLEAKPTLFRSVHLQDDFPQELMPENDSVREILKTTAIPELMSTIPNRLTAKAAVTVKELSQAVLMKKYNLLGDGNDGENSLNAVPQREAIGFGSSRSNSVSKMQEDEDSKNDTSRLEARLSSFAFSLNAFKSELLSAARQIEPELTAAAAQGSAQLLAQYNMRMTVEEVAAIVRNVAARPLVDAGQHAWRLAMSDVPRKAGVIQSSTQSLLSECATVIDLKFPSKAIPDPEQQARQLKLQDYVRTTNEDCIKHMARFQDVLNQDVAPLAKDATIKSLQQHFIADPVSGRLSHVQDLPALCPKTAAAIFARFNHVVKSAITHLDALQNEVIRTLRAITFAIKTHASTTHNSTSQHEERLMAGDTTSFLQQTQNLPFLGAAAAQQQYSSTINKLAAQNALNWPSATVEAKSSQHTSDFGSHASQRANNGASTSMDVGEEVMETGSSEMQTVYENAADDPREQIPRALSSFGSVSSDASSQYSSNVSLETHVANYGEQTTTGDEIGSERFGPDGKEHVLTPWAELKGVYSVLPQEESGVLYQYQLWDHVRTHASSARLYFETLLKQSRIAMGKSQSEYFSDGNAQFRVLAHQVYGTDATHAIVRLLVCSEMLSNPDYYAHLLFLSRPTSARMMDIQEYVALMSHEGCRGDNLTLCAFANFFGVDLLIFAPPFRQPILLRSRRSTSHGHLAVVAQHLNSTNLAEPFVLNASSSDGSTASTGNNKAFCIAMLPDDEFAILKPLTRTKARRRQTAPQQAPNGMDAYESVVEADDEDSEYEGKNARGTRAASGPTTGQQKLARMVQLRKAFDRRKAMETQIEPSSPNGSTFYRGENAYEDLAESDASDSDPVSDSDASQAEIARAIRSSTSKKRKRTSNGNTTSANKTKHLRSASSPTSNLDSIHSTSMDLDDYSTMRGQQQHDQRQHPFMNRSSSLDRIPEEEGHGSYRHFEEEEEDPSVDQMYRKKFKFAVENSAATDASSTSSASSTLTQESGDYVVTTLQEHSQRARTLHTTATNVLVNSSNAMDVSSTDPPSASSLELDSSRRRSSSTHSNTGGSGKTGSVKMLPYDPILSHRVCRPPSLIDLCLQSLVDGIESGLIPTLSGQVPEEYLQKVLLILSERKRLTDSNVARVLDPTMSTLMIYGPSAHVTDITMTNVAHECAMLKDLILVQCSNITTPGLVSVASSCSQLVHVTIKGCAGIGNRAIQEVARKCPKLEFFDGSGCPQITDVALKDLFVACPQLSTVIMQHCNQLTDEAFAHYVGRNVQVLDLLEAEQLTNRTLVSIARHVGPRLRILKMSGRGISDTGVEPLARACTELRVIEFTHAENISDAAIAALWTHCRHLFTVNIAHCRQITDAAFGPKIAPIDERTFRSMMADPERSLNLTPELDSDESVDNTAAAASTATGAQDVAGSSGFGVSNTSSVSPFAARLSMPSDVTKLNLAMCLNITDNALRLIAFQCQSLRHLIVSYCEELSDVGVVAVALHCGDLRTLDVTKCMKVTNVGVKAIAERCGQLKTLLVGNVVTVSDESIVPLASNCPLLKNLDLCSTAVTDVSMTAIATSCPQLKLLALSDCRFITSFGLSSIADSCSNLEVIRLSGCKAIDDNSMKRLSIGCPNVLELDLAHCNSLSSHCLQKSLASWSKLLTLNLRGYTPLIRRAAAPSSSSAAEDLDAPVRIKHSNLEDLNLSWCKFVDDAMVAALADGSPNLITLDLGWCTSVTANAFHRLAQKCRNLRTLNLRGCTKVGPLSVQYLSAASVVVYR